MSKKVCIELAENGYILEYTDEDGKLTTTLYETSYLEKDKVFTHMLFLLSNIMAPEKKEDDKNKILIAIVPKDFDFPN